MRLNLSAEGRRWQLGRFAPKNKGATDCSVAPRLVPSPRYFAKFKLLQGCESYASRNRDGRNDRSRVEADHALFRRAEAAYTSLIRRSGRAANDVALVGNGRECGQSEIISALRSGWRDSIGQDPVDQASASLGRKNTGTAGDGWRAQDKHRACISLCGISGLVRNLSSIHGTNRASCRRFVCRDTRT